jgi:hypothetical protein
VSRVIDRGAIVAGWIGVGMAAVIVVSFVLVIPIGDVAVAFLALPAGLIIGYYANQRSARSGGPWPRILANAAWAGLVTGLASALLLLGVKAIFFTADDGYRDASLGGPIECAGGADCVWQRYLASGRGPALEAVGVTDVESFTRFYWQEQLSTAGTLVVVTVVGGLFGGILYRVANREPGVPGKEA